MHLLWPYPECYKVTYFRSEHRLQSMFNLITKQAHEIRKANKLKRLSRTYQNVQMRQYDAVEHPQLLAVGRTIKYLMGHRSDNMYKGKYDCSLSLRIMNLSVA